MKYPSSSQRNESNASCSHCCMCQAGWFAVIETFNNFRLCGVVFWLSLSDSALNSPCFIGRTPPNVPILVRLYLSGESRCEDGTILRT